MKINIELSLAIVFVFLESEVVMDECTPLPIDSMYIVLYLYPNNHMHGNDYKRMFSSGRNYAICLVSIK